MILPGLLWLAGAAGCGSVFPEELVKLTEQGKSTTIESHTDFQTFEYNRSPGSGFESAPGDIVAATITRAADGHYELALDVLEGHATPYPQITWEQLESWNAESIDDASYDGFGSGWGSGDLTVRHLPVRTLTAAEMQRMLSVFAAVPVEYEYIEAMIDYYVFDDVRWDDRRLSGNPNYGYSETILYAKLEEIIRMLEDFRSAGEP
jgi:hypothetical protein